jgi:hypothetical protein
MGYRAGSLRMIDVLARLFVGKPLHILVVALVFGIGYAGLRSAGRHATPLLALAGAWLLYAAWEWLVQTRTPEADIRVDLLVIWPVLALLTAWFMFKALR